MAAKANNRAAKTAFRIAKFRTELLEIRSETFLAIHATPIAEMIITIGSANAKYLRNFPTKIEKGINQKKRHQKTKYLPSPSERRNIKTSPMRKPAIVVNG